MSSMDGNNALSSSSPYKSKIAVVLNVNARSVSQSMISIAENIIGKEHIYVTRSVEDNEKAAEQIIDRGYNMIVPAGGDGTLCSVINAIVSAHRLKCQSSLDESNVVDKRLPKFAFLPLGTGNGMGMLVGPRFKGRKKKKVQTMLTQLKQIVDDYETKNYDIPLIPCPMIEISSDKTEIKESSMDKGTKNNELCFFAGAGFDSLMLNDFNIIKRWSSNKPGLNRVLGSVAGYTVALFLRTLPQCFIWGKHRIQIRITVPKPNTKDHVNDYQSKIDSTYWIDPRRGDTALEIIPTQTFINLNENPTETKSMFSTDIASNRQLLFEGETGIVAAGTTPYYGGGLKLFPFSRVQPHHMHLRLGRINPIVGFFNIPWIFRGSYRHYDMGCLDFLGSDFEVELSQPYPFQHSGEAVDDGISKFKLRVADEEIEFVDFLKPRLVVGY